MDAALQTRIRRFGSLPFRRFVITVWIWLGVWLAGAVVLTLSSARLPHIIWIYWQAKSSPAAAYLVPTGTIILDAWIPAAILLAVAIEFTVIAALAQRPAARAIRILANGALTSIVIAILGALALYFLIAGESALMSVPHQVGRPPLADEDAAVQALGPFSSHTTITVNAIAVIVVIAFLVGTRIVARRVNLASRDGGETAAE
jgi:hypothetical protein